MGPTGLRRREEPDDGLPSSSDCTQEGEEAGEEREKERETPTVAEDLEDWFSATSCCARADAPAACFAPDPRADCDRAACRNFKPGRLARNRGKFEITVNSVFRAWDGLTGSYWPGDSWIEVGGDEDDCRGKYVYHTYIDDNGKERAVLTGTSPPEARYCADDRTPAGVDVVPGVGTCCLNASGDASCAAKTAACFHGSGPRRCDVLLKYFGSFDRRTWEERDYWDTSGWNESHLRASSPPTGNSSAPAPATLWGEPYACDDLRCDPASGALYTSARIRGAGGTSSRGSGRRSATRSPARATGGAPTSVIQSRGRPRRGTGAGASASASRRCGVVTEDGDFFHAQLRAWKRWDEAWLYKTDYNTRGRTEWDHPWENFWASTRAPRKFAGLDAAPAAASADACARAAAREFHRGCRDVCGKTCAELGHDPATFARLRRAVKAWPARGGGDEIPDVCGFAPATGVHLFRPIWVTWGQGLTFVGLVGIWVLGIVLACCVSQPSCRGYARLQRVPELGHREFEGRDRSPLVRLRLLRRLGLRAGHAPWWRCSSRAWSSVGCCSVGRARRARAREARGGAREKFRERRPRFRRYVVPCLDKLSAGVASLFRRHVAPWISSRPASRRLGRKRGRRRASGKAVRRRAARVEGTEEGDGPPRPLPRPLPLLLLLLPRLASPLLLRARACSFCLVKRPPAAVYTAEDGTEQTVPWVVAPGPPGTIVWPPGRRQGTRAAGRPAGPALLARGGGARGRRRRRAETRRRAAVAHGTHRAPRAQGLGRKKRTLGALVKQVSVPLLGVGILWLLYDIKERNKKKQSTGASATGAPTPVDGGGAASRERTTFDTNHGDLELFMFQYLFVPWVQEVASALVGDVAAGTREATRAAGGADAAYWLASLLIEGVAIGGGVSVAIAAFAAPGLFRRAGKSFEVAAFFELFALHWLFLLALTLQTFVVVTCLLRSQIAAAGLPPLLHAALHGCYFAWNPLRRWAWRGIQEEGTNWRLWARPRAHFASAASCRSLPTICWWTRSARRESERAGGAGSSPTALWGSATRAGRAGKSAGTRPQGRGSRPSSSIWPVSR